MKPLIRLLLVLLCWALQAEAVAAPDLLAVLALAQAHDPELAAAAAARRAGQEALPQARSALLPQLGASGGISRAHRELEPSSSPTRNYTSKDLTLSLRQVIFDRDKFGALNQADAKVALADLQWEKAQQDLVLRVAEAYLDLLFAADSVRLAQAKMEAITAQKHQAEQMYRGGVGTVTDIQEAQSRYDLAVAEELEAQNRLHDKRRVLYRLTGQSIKTVAPVVIPLPLSVPEPDTLEFWLEAARRTSLEVLLAEKGSEITRLDVRRARSGHLPVLEAVARAQWQGNTDLGYTKDRIASVGLQLTVPLYAGGSVNSRVRERLARLDQAQADLQRARAESETRSADAFEGVHDAIARVRALKQAVRSSEVALDAARIGLEVGYRTSVDVLNAQQQLFAARRDLQQQRYAYIIQRLKLKAAVGALTASAIAALDHWFSESP